MLRQAVGVPRHPGGRGARAEPADHPAGLGPRRRGASWTGPASWPRSSARRVVVVHPPFRWQREYAREFEAGLTRLSPTAATSRSRSRTSTRCCAAAPRCARTRRTGTRSSWTSPHATLDVSHAAVSGSDVLEMAEAARRRGSRTCTWATAPSRACRTSIWCPAAARSRAPSCCGWLRAAGYEGVVVLEVSTHRRQLRHRLADLAESLDFARPTWRHPAAARRAPARGRGHGRSQPGRDRSAGASA